MKTKRKPLRDLRVPAWWIGGLVVTAFVLRVIGLDDGLWVDEIDSLLRSFRRPLAQILTESPGDQPLYSVLAHLSLTLFGEYAWSIRLPSLLFGVASVPLLYRLGKRVTRNREAFFATALLTVSFHHVWFSQNARGYAALAFFTMLATLLLLRGLDRPSLRIWIGYGVVAALGCYTDLAMVFTVVGQALVILVRNLRVDADGKRWRDGRGPWIGFVLAGAFTLVCYAPILVEVQRFFLHPSPIRGLSTLGWAALEAVRGLIQGLGAGGRILAGMAVTAAGCLFCVGVASYARSAPLALGLFIAPGLVTLAGGVVVSGTMYPRFYFSLIGFGILIGVRGTMVAAGWIAARWQSRSVGRAGTRLGTAFLAGMIVLSAASLLDDYAYPKQDFEGVRDWFEWSGRADETIVTVGATTVPYRDWLKLPWRIARSAIELEALSRDSGRTWVVYTLPRYLEHSAPDLMQKIERDCRTARVFGGTVGGGDIIACILVPVTPAPP